MVEGQVEFVRELFNSYNSLPQPLTMAGAPRPGGFNPHLPGEHEFAAVSSEYADLLILIVSLRSIDSGLGHRLGAKLLGASMWCFLFYRMRADGPVLLVSPLERSDSSRNVELTDPPFPVKFRACDTLGSINGLKRWTVCTDRSQSEGCSSEMSLVQ